MARHSNRIVGLDEAPGEEIQKDPVVADTVVTGANHDEALSGNKVRVTFHEQDGDIGKLPLQIGHNGYAYLVPRNTPVVLPVEVLGVVRDAEETVYESKAGVVSERKRPRFSFTVHGAV